ncbi:RWD domain-containing protein 1 [Irineochytrium annulatum]|nr:RWD domain-containing protein 1 [Irineochytrium annulatum]
MDYTEEQANELEALKSIFFDTFEEIDPGPPATFRIPVAIDDDPASDEARFHLRVTYTPTYPDAAPELTLEDAVDLDEEELASLEAGVRQSADDQLGMASVFGVHAQAKDLLEDLVRTRAERREKEEEERIAREEEAERVRYAGTKVTVESFAAWREGFRREMAELEKKAALAAGGGKALLKEANKGKVRGRALFEKDRSLAKSDVAMMAEGDVTVDIDQELFAAEAEGLGLDDDEEEVNAVLANFTEDD